MEECDCWYANPTWQMETDVIAGKYGGSMFGLVPTPQSSTEAAKAAASSNAGTHNNNIDNNNIPQVEKARANLLRAAASAGPKTLSL